MFLICKFFIWYIIVQSSLSELDIILAKTHADVFLSLNCPILQEYKQTNISVPSRQPPDHSNVNGLMAFLLFQHSGGDNLSHN